MKIALKTLKKYKEGVKNSMTTNYTNGCLEGINNIVKCIKRIAFGYRSFKNFRKRILIVTGVLCLSN